MKKEIETQIVVTENQVIRVYKYEAGGDGNENKASSAPLQSSVSFKPSEMWELMQIEVFFS